MKDKRYNVIDTITGELVDYINTGDKILRESSEEIDNSLLKWNCGGFIKGNISELKLLSPTLTQSQRSLLFALLPYVNYKDCLICHSNGKDINLGDISTIATINIKTARKITRELVAIDILCINKNSRNNQYFMNPWLIYRGVSINKTLKAMFKNYQIRSLGDVQWKDLK